MTFAPGTKVDYDFHVSTDIAFADFDAVKGQGVGPTLAKFVGLTEGIVARTAQRFFP